MNENLEPFLAGWGAGMFGILMGQPLDTIKTYQQTHNVKLSCSKAIKLIFEKDGIHGFYKGMFLPLLCSGSSNSIYFGVYEISMELFQMLRGYNKVDPNNCGWLQDLFAAGLIGGSAQTFITCPTELIKIRMQIGKGIIKKEEISTNVKKMNTHQIIKTIYRNYGIRYFFVGLIPTIWRDAVGGAVYIVSYQCTRYYMYGEFNPNPRLFETLVAGGLAGIASWIPVIPFDTIKSRIQADDFHKPRYKGMIDCTANLFRQSGFSAFFKGFFMISIRSIPVNISVIYGYELILWFCRQCHHKSLLNSVLGK